MSLYKHLIFPLLKSMDPERAHERTARALAFAQDHAFTRGILGWIAGYTPNRPVEAFGLTFPNVLGVAAGFDKDVHLARGLAALGFGHIEVGTLTPRPQPGNPKPRIFRLPTDHALINRMGFPNGGVDAALPRLAALTALPGRRFRIGVSLGKQKETPLENAAGDYIAVMRKVWHTADYLAVNISSPNTPGLRELQGGDYLGQLLRALMLESISLAEKHGTPRRPLLVKIAPDLSWAELDAMLAVFTDVGVDGVIATNTTLAREGLSHPARAEMGGMSGAPMAEVSTGVIRHIVAATGGKLPVVGVGGIHDAATARAKLDAGAVLLQIYTGLVYEGPRLAGRILRELWSAE